MQNGFEDPKNQANAKSKDNKSRMYFRRLSYGVLSGISVSVALQPLDVLKTRSQYYSNSSIARILQTLASRPKSSWYGATPTILKQSIGIGLYISTLTYIREDTHVIKMMAAGGKHREMFLEGSLSFLLRTAVVLMTMPLAVLKTRCEVIDNK